jgi:hypothetical protein
LEDEGISRLHQLSKVRESSDSSAKALSEHFTNRFKDLLIAEKRSLVLPDQFSAPVQEFCFSLPSREQLLALVDAAHRMDGRIIVSILAKHYGVDPPDVIIDPDLVYKHVSGKFLNTNALYFPPSPQKPHGLIALKTPRGCSPFTLGHEMMHHLAHRHKITVCEGVCDLFGNALSVACYANPLYIARFWTRHAQHLEFIREPKTIAQIVAKFSRLPYVLRSDISSMLIKRVRLGRQVRLQLNELGRDILVALKSGTVVE